MKSTFQSLLGFSLLSLSACMGAPGDEDISASAEALDSTIAKSVWQSAPAGCEGVSLDGVTIASADGAPDLGVVVRDSNAVCVDSLDALNAQRRDALSTIRGSRSGSPSPQPNRPFVGGRSVRVPRGLSQGSPSPQPNSPRDTVSGSPSPQPNLPRDLASGSPSPQPNTPRDTASGSPSPQPNSPRDTVSGSPSPQPNTPR